MPKKRDFFLVSQPCVREGFTNYTDLYLCWYYNDRLYAVRIRPCFFNDMKTLYAVSEKVDAGVNLASALVLN